MCYFSKTKHCWSHPNEHEQTESELYSFLPSNEFRSFFSKAKLGHEKVIGDRLPAGEAHLQELTHFWKLQLEWKGSWHHCYFSPARFAESGLQLPEVLNRNTPRLLAAYVTAMQKIRNRRAKNSSKTAPFPPAGGTWHGEQAVWEGEDPACVISSLWWMGRGEEGRQGTRLTLWARPFLVVQVVACTACCLVTSDTPAHPDTFPNSPDENHWEWVESRGRRRSKVCV